MYLPVDPGRQEMPRCRGSNKCPRGKRGGPWRKDKAGRFVLLGQPFGAAPLGEGPMASCQAWRGRHRRAREEYREGKTVQVAWKQKCFFRDGPDDALATPGQRRGGRACRGGAVPAPPAGASPPHRARV